MSLPIRTTLDDVMGVCRYLSTKATGATVAEARKVLDGRLLDGRKLTALRRWGLIEDQDGRLRLTDDGRLLAKNNFSDLPSVLKAVIRRVAPYAAIIERVAHKGEESLSATEVAAHWHTHFKDEVAGSDTILNDQAVCFFQVASGAKLGVLVVGRKGAPTRFDFDSNSVRAFIEGERESHDRPDIGVDPPLQRPRDPAAEPDHGVPEAVPKSNRVFITHGKNRGIIDQLKEIVRFGKFEPVLAIEHETSSKPVPDKVLDDMRACSAGIIHIEAEETLIDAHGQPRHVLNDNVLIEIGAAMALFPKRFIFLVQSGVQMPSNLQGLYECRYSGDKLDGDATMRLLKAFNDFR